MCEPEIIDLTGESDGDSDATIVAPARRLLRSAISRAPSSPVPAIFLSDADIDRVGVQEAPRVRLTTENLPRLGLQGGTRFWAIASARAEEPSLSVESLCEHRVLALDEVPDDRGVKEVLRLGNANLVSDAIVIGAHVSSGPDASAAVIEFFTTTRPAGPGGGAPTVVHLWRGRYDVQDAAVAPESMGEQTIFVLGA